MRVVPRPSDRPTYDGKPERRDRRAEVKPGPGGSKRHGEDTAPDGGVVAHNARMVAAIRSGHQ